MRRLMLILLLAFLCSPALAQRGFSGGHFAGHFPGGFGAQHGGRYWGGYPLGFGYSDSLFPDYYPEYPSGAPSIVVIQQAAAPAEPSAPPLASRAQPLLIELRGGRYVRVSGEQSSSAGDSDPAMYASSPGAVETSRTSLKPASTILVFRDGSREEITGYTIADGVLYAQANYYADGAWNRKIELSSLNLPATVNENRARGVRFQLPTAANEVIVGP